MNDYSTDTTTTHASIVPGLMTDLVIYLLAGFLLGRMFTKAGEAMWKGFVPFYNIYIMLKLAGRPGWWLVLYFIPIVGLVISIIVALDLAKAFGKSGVFGFFGLWLFALVGYAILAFGSATYQGPSVKGAAAPTV